MSSRAVDSAPLRVGERIQLTDPKGRKHTLVLAAGKRFHTSKGAIAHDDLIGRSEGVVVTSAKGTEYLALRPLLSDFVMSMPRGAAVVYPKDAAAIVGLADVFPGARVVEAGAGSGALTCSLLRAVGPEGFVSSFDRRKDFAETATDNVCRFFGEHPPNWTLTVGDLSTACEDHDVERVVLDMLAPWECLPKIRTITRPGAVVCAYVTTTTQMSCLVEALRSDGCWTEPDATETLVRTWHVDGLAVRPDHRMVGHTGFIVTTRRLADGTTAPVRRTRPSKANRPSGASGGNTRNCR